MQLNEYQQHRLEEQEATLALLTREMDYLRTDLRAREREVERLQGFAEETIRGGFKLRLGSHWNALARYHKRNSGGNRLDARMELEADLIQEVAEWFEQQGYRAADEITLDAYVRGLAIDLIDKAT